MVTISRFISASLQPFARACVSDCHGEKQQREENHQQVHINVLGSSKLDNCASKLHHDGESQSSFIVLEVRAETSCRHTRKARCRGEKWTCHEQRTRYDRAGIRTGDYAWKSINAWS